MKYTATNWKKGDSITAESLNKIESALEELAALTEKEPELVKTESKEEKEPEVVETDSKEEKEFPKITKAKKG
ncbi:hypothetical protein [Carnobacterium inhibens]|uniref:hypothetical protein n=1 Tax=Carnobacterium inhibens TaxID=147709 RepID=UPI00203B32F6|nr:hypothetical protein [Carnobacterium inhibens]MCM3511645.1 hypothetical protein [Carnobacterium inhibens]